jgi:hypothetical protein
MTLWTASMVEERLEESADTLRRLPPVKVRGYFGVWPEILYDISDKRGWEARLVVLGPPSAAAISRMEETLTWFRWLTKFENRLIWLRANRVRWKVICPHIGYERTMAWERWVFALSKVAYRLNEQPLERQLSLIF